MYIYVYILKFDMLKNKSNVEIIINLVLIFFFFHFLAYLCVNKQNWLCSVMTLLVACHLLSKSNILWNYKFRWLMQLQIFWWKTKKSIIVKERNAWLEETHILCKKLDGFLNIRILFLIIYIINKKLISCRLIIFFFWLISMHIM